MINPRRPRFRGRAFNMKPTEPNVMKMTHHDREYLLSQIAAVLSNLECLVSQLSNVKIEEDAVSTVKNLCQRIVAPSLSLMSNDVMHTIAFDCDVESTTSEVSSVSSKLSWDMKEDYPVSPVSERITEVNSNIVKSVPEECPFVNKIKCFILNFSNSVYSQEKSAQIRQEWFDEGVVNEFQFLWRSAIVGDLFGQNPEANESLTTPPPTPPVIMYNTIDFTKVNVPTFLGPSTKLSMDAPRTRSSTRKVSSFLTITTTDPTPWRAATRKPSPSVPCMVTRPTSELFLSPTRQYTGTFGVTTPEVSFSMQWTLQKVPRLRPAHRGRDLLRGDRHQPGGDGRPEVPGERRRGVATQYCHVITAAVFVSSHIYLALLMY